MPTNPALDADGRVAKDLACIQCGYNLRTLHREARCPECGLAVRRSLRGDWLKHSDPAWLAKIAGGLGWMLRGGAVSLLCSILPFVIALVSGAFGSTGRNVFVSVVAMVLEVALLVGVLGGLVGLWVFTTPEPKPVGPESDLDQRRLVRFLGCAGMVAVFASALPDDQSTLGCLLRQVAVLSVLMWCAAVELYVRRLALRIPDDQEASRAWTVFIGFLIVIAFTVWSLTAEFGVPGSGFFADLLGAGGCLGIMLFVAYIVQLNRFRRILCDIAEETARMNAT
jgi:hypothetical protein